MMLEKCASNIGGYKVMGRLTDRGRREGWNLFFFFFVLIFFLLFSLYNGFFSERYMLS